MKKNIFFIAIFLLAGGFIILSIASHNGEKIKEKGVSIDLEEGEKLYGWKKEKKGGSFKEINLSGIHDPHDFYYHRFSPIDGVYYRSDEESPMKIEIVGGKKVLTFGT